MAIGKRLGDFLQRQHAEYARSVHPRAETARQVAYEEAISAHRLAKTLVFHGDGGFGMAVLPADFRVDLSELKFVLGLRNIRLATEEELQHLFPDCETGAMPPFGNIYGLPVVVDANLAQSEVIAFNAGTHRDVVYMRFTDFCKAVKPAIEFFAVAERHWTPPSRDCAGVAV